MSSDNRSVTTAGSAAELPPPSYFTANSGTRASTDSQRNESSEDTPPDSPPPSYEEATNERAGDSTTTPRPTSSTGDRDAVRRVERYTSPNGRVTSTSTFFPGSNSGIQAGYIESVTMNSSLHGSFGRIDTTARTAPSSSGDETNAVRSVTYTSSDGRVTSVNTCPTNNRGIQVGAVSGGTMIFANGTFHLHATQHGHGHGATVALRTLRRWELMRFIALVARGHR
ncbi:hypothetical protein LTR65_002508 [Meristemomyces frigidus]